MKKRSIVLIAVAFSFLMAGSASAQEDFPNYGTTFIAVYDEYGNLVGEPGCRSTTNKESNPAMKIAYVGFAELEKGKNYKVYARITCESDREINTEKTDSPTLFLFSSWKMAGGLEWNDESTIKYSMTPATGLGGTTTSAKIYDTTNGKWFYTPDTAHFAMCSTDYWYMSDFQVPDAVEVRSSIMVKIPLNLTRDIYAQDNVLELKYKVK